MACVLLIDDHPAILELGVDMLEALGHACICAATGEAGVKALSERPGEIDVIIMDFLLPDLDGAELFVRLKRIDPACRVIVSSGAEAGDQISGLLGQGAVGSLRKPYRVGDLKKALETALGA